MKAIAILSGLIVLCLAVLSILLGADGELWKSNACAYGAGAMTVCTFLALIWFD